MENDTQQNTEILAPKQEKVRLNMKRVKIIIGTLLAIIIAVGAVALWLYFKNRPTADSNGATTSQTNKAELQKLIEQVGKLILLPQDEEPTLATITDTRTLKDQAFFANAENGDKVLIYTKAKKAILYSPSKNKIIEVSPVNLGAPEPGTALLPATSSKP